MTFYHWLAAKKDYLCYKFIPVKSNSYICFRGHVDFYAL